MGIILHYFLFYVFCPVQSDGKQEAGSILLSFHHRLVPIVMTGDISSSECSWNCQHENVSHPSLYIALGVPCVLELFVLLNQLFILLSLFDY